MQIGIVLFPDITALDAVGPFEVLARIPGAQVHWVAERPGPISAQYGLQLTAGTAWADCPPLDVLLVPGGPGQVAAMQNPALLRFIQDQGSHATWVTAVCTGSLLLGAAGLLRGYRATTHWRYHDCLRDLGAIPMRKRVVADRNRITAAGVSAGIDLALFLAAMLAGEQTAQLIQLQLEYDPQPPFCAGSPDRADEQLIEAVEQQTQAMYEQRRQQTLALAPRLRS